MFLASVEGKSTSKAEEGTSTCSKLMDNSCAAAYQQAELDCARDPHSRPADGSFCKMCRSVKQRCLNEDGNPWFLVAAHLESLV